MSDLSNDSDIEDFDSDYHDEDDHQASQLAELNRNRGKKPDALPPHESVSPERLRARVDREIEEVVDILGVEHPIASILLLHFRWNKDRIIERYMDSPNSVLKEIGEPDVQASQGTSSPPSKRLRSTSPSSERVCGVCFDEGTLLHLKCGHRFCDLCWAAYATTQVKDEGRYILRCMGSKCQMPAYESFIKGIVDEQCFERYQTLILQSYVAANPDYRFCPHPSCTETVYCQGARGSLLLTQVPTVKCRADHTFCFGCGLDSSHRPAICKIASMWIDAKEDSGTSQWIKANTRTCPKCNNSIEKSGGCNRMLCRQCKYQFCWMCMKNWDVHGYNNSVCNAFVEPEKDANMTEAAVKLERWLFYFDRFNNHELSSRLDQELCERTQEKMVEIQEASDLSWIQTKFMQTAVDELTRCRFTLKWTYAMAHFLAKGNQKEMFEDIQADLERAVEQLSQMLDEPITKETIKELRQRVTDKTVYVTKRHEVVLDDVAKGLMEGQWEWTVPLD
ncbi:hypothetical protein BD410DRAFT_791225 [Rickenella mellea]|uniref:RBR-type E3 ubiquitin transferase n=1 Tax=Rickenella mellea TaxID=50990 RepID=A0A4Y7Q022_9AGAM|nr:hypothetical protein BD410DRAFT_791225 [Rickenella mellea]